MAVGRGYALGEDDVFVSHVSVSVRVTFVVVNCAKKNFRFTKA